MEASEAINDSSKFVAKALEFLNAMQNPEITKVEFAEQLNGAKRLLEEALDKLTNKM